MSPSENPQSMNQKQKESQIEITTGTESKSQTKTLTQTQSQIHSHTQIPLDVHHFESFVLTAGCKYLEVGGPTSRLEDKIVQLGEAYNLQPEVFATPSAVIVSAMNSEKRYTSSLKRIKETGIDLNILFKIDVLFDDVISKKISVNDAFKIVGHKNYSAEIYSKKLISVSSFIVGFLGSYLNFQNIYSGILSGLLSLILVAILQPFFTSLAFTRIFFVFFASLFSIGISALAEAYFKLPIEASFIGSLIVLVPGLMLTTAVSELAEHNFVSGTVKLVNGVLILISIGTALFIGKDIIYLLNPTALPLNLDYTTQIGVDLMTSIGGTLLIMLAFCFQFQTPRKFILFAMMTGIAGQIGFELFKNSASYALPSFVAALFIGLASLSFSRFFKTPSQIFSVPGIVSLVPGVLSFTIYNSTSLGTGLSDSQSTSDSKILTVAIIASSLVFGLIMSRFPFRIYKKTRGLPFIPTE